MPVVARVYVVRHGETDANRAHIIQGQLDTSLNAMGLEQAQLASEALKHIPFDFAWTSDLKRASATADAILVHHPDVPVQRQEDLRERDMGLMQGQPLVPGAKSAAAVDLKAEPATAFRARLLKWWDKTILDRTASLPPPKDDPYRILVVSHGGVITDLVKGLVANKKIICAKGVVIWKCFNASVSIIDILEDQSGVLVQFADVAHLKEGAVESNADELLNIR